MRTIFDDDEPGSFIKSAIEQCLSRFGYAYTAKGGDYRFHIAVKGGARFRTQLLVTEEAVIRKWVFLTDKPYKKERQLWVRQAAEVLNTTLVFGSLILQEDTGAIIFRDALQLFEEPSPEDIEAFLNRCATPVQLWVCAYDLIQDEICDGTTAAIFSTLWNGCMDDEGEMTDDVRRELLSVANGREQANETVIQPPTLGLI